MVRWRDCSLLNAQQLFAPGICTNCVCCFETLNKMASSLLAVGIGLAAVGYAGRFLFRRMPILSQKMTETMKKLDSASLANNKYYKGGFETRMTKREASLILGVSPTAGKAKVKEHFKKVMSVNHPDRGGSPYIAAKINEAKDTLEK